MAFKSSSSRFAFLSDDASDPFETVSKKGKNKAPQTGGSDGGGNKTGNKPNKNKKKSSSAKDTSNSNSTSDKKELQTLAFGLEGSKKKKSQPAQTAQNTDPSSIAQGDHDHVVAENSQKSQSPNRPVGMNDEQWEAWQQRDIEYVSGAFESDLEAALMQSKLDFQAQQSRAQQESQNKTKGKKKPVSVPLKDFNAMLSSGAPLVPPAAEPPKRDWSPNGYMHSFPDKEMEKIRLEAQMEMRRERQLELDRQLLQSRNQHVPLGPMSLDNVANLEFRHILAEKDAIITKLTAEKMEKMELEKELEITRTRFKKLWSVVTMSNLKDKVYLSAEVEKLTQLNQHLNEEITTLHTQLEQERSRSHAAVLECRKLEQSRRRTGSTTEVN